IAKAMLKEKQMQFITGEALTAGIPELKAGHTVEIKVNDPRFDGKYYVDSVRHRFVHSVAGIGGVAHREAGFRTYMHVMRDSQGSGGGSSSSQSENGGGGGGGGGGG